jgi:hydroxymethylglutaryl-CoA lyase
VPQLADAAAVLAACGADALPRLRVLVPNPRGLELALDNGVHNVLVTVAATESFNMRNVNRSVAESLNGIEEIVRRGQGEGCTVDVAVSVCFGCPFEGWVDPRRVVDVCRELVRLGVDEVGIADTIGVADPSQVRDLVMRVQAVVDIGSLSLHTHDTRGMAVASVLAAYEVGIRRFEGSVGGLGGCPFAPRSTGNVCSEDALYALQRIGAAVGVDIDAYCAVAERLGEDLGMTLPGKLHRAGVWRPENIAAASAGAAP